MIFIRNETRKSLICKLFINWFRSELKREEFYVENFKWDMLN